MLGIYACFLFHIELKIQGMDAPMPTLIPHAVIKPINHLLLGSYVMALLSYLKLNLYARISFGTGLIWLV